MINVRERFGNFSVLNLNEINGYRFKQCSSYLDKLQIWYSKNSHTLSHHVRNETLNHTHRNSIPFLMLCTYNVHDVIDAIPLPDLSSNEVP